MLEMQPVQHVASAQSTFSHQQNPNGMTMKKIVVIGEILVEIMADTPGEGFDGPQPLTGPFPSGAPAIFADQVAKLGQPVGIISAVGNDDFGRINLDRLREDAVDISAIHIDHDRPTGSAFVRYRADGSRDFVFNIKHSASGRLHKTPAVETLLASADHLHVMGSSLSSAEFVDLNLEATEAIKARGGTISFDPNLRKEFLSAPGMAEAMARIVALTDLFLPSGDELTLLTQAQDSARRDCRIAGQGHPGNRAQERVQGRNLPRCRWQCFCRGLPGAGS